MALKWLKKGDESVALAKQEAVEHEKRKAEQGKMWRFFLKENEEAKITFVDGDLNDEGFLLPPRYYEHNIYQNGSWNNHYVCPEKTNPGSGDKCPLCEGGDKPALVALFTIIDHREQKSKSGNEVFTNTPRLLVAKSITYELLAKIAAKRGGLANATFDVSRIGDKAAAVGSMFDYMEKNEPETLKKEFTRKVKGADGKEKVETVFKVANYEEEIVYRSEEELRAMGFGKGGSGQPSQQGGQSLKEKWKDKGSEKQGEHSEPADNVDYSNQL